MESQLRACLAGRLSIQSNTYYKKSILPLMVKAKPFHNNSKNMNLKNNKKHSDWNLHTIQFENNLSTAANWNYLVWKGPAWFYQNTRNPRQYYPNIKLTWSIQKWPTLNAGSCSSVAMTTQYHRIRRYSRSVTQASICPHFYKRFVINHAILASTTGTLYLPKPDKNFWLY
jgi:hypothetical protein